MTVLPAHRRLPVDATLVEVDGSQFLLEWLDWEVLAAAAAASRPRRPEPSSPEPALPR
jgi:hypothetical protein